MRNRNSLVLVVTLIAALSASACDDDDDNGNGRNGTPLQPTRISSVFVPAFAVGVRPTRLARRSIPGALCPGRQPFLVPLELLLENASGSHLSLDRVGFQFFDSWGVAGTQTMIRQPNLVRQFGNVGLAPQSSRVFPFSVEFGCGTGSTGLLSVLVGTIDADGVPHERTFRIVID